MCLDSDDSNLQPPVPSNLFPLHFGEGEPSPSVILGVAAPTNFMQLSQTLMHRVLPELWEGRQVEYKPVAVLRIIS